MSRVEEAVQDRNLSRHCSEGERAGVDSVVEGHVRESRGDRRTFETKSVHIYGSKRLADVRTLNTPTPLHARAAEGKEDKTGGLRGIKIHNQHGRVVGDDSKEKSTLVRFGAC